MVAGSEIRTGSTMRRELTRGGWLQFYYTSTFDYFSLPTRRATSSKNWTKTGVRNSFVKSKFGARRSGSDGRNGRQGKFRKSRSRRFGGCRLVAAAESWICSLKVRQCPLFTAHCVFSPR